MWPFGRGVGTSGASRFSCRRPGRPSLDRCARTGCRTLAPTTGTPLPTLRPLSLSTWLITRWPCLSVQLVVVVVVSVVVVVVVVGLVQNGRDMSRRTALARRFYITYFFFPNPTAHVSPPTLLPERNAWTIHKNPAPRTVTTCTWRNRTREPRAATRSEPDKNEWDNTNWNPSLFDAENYVS